MHTHCFISQNIFVLKFPFFIFLDWTNIAVELEPTNIAVDLEPTNIAVELEPVEQGVNLLVSQARLRRS